MLEELELLLELQDMDLELNALKRRRDRLPGRIAELEEERNRLNAEVVSRQEEADERAKEHRHIERELEDQTARLESLRAKQITIKTNEEYAALQREIEFEQTRISESEEAILSLLEEQESLKARLSDAKESAEESSGRIDSEVSELKKKLGDLDQELQIKRDERGRVAMRVDEHLLDRYERTLKSKGDAAVVQVTDGTCSGCRMRLPPQMVIEVKRSTRLMECESCGRILYWKGGGGSGQERG